MIFSTHHRRVIFAALAACACISGPVFADGQPKDVVVFGDSLSDPGNAFALTHTLSNTPYMIIPAAPYAVGGLHFSNGKTWIEQRPADNVNSQSSGPAYQVHGVFTNYAVGGARARTVSGGVNLGAQVQTYLNDFGGIRQGQQYLRDFHWRERHPGRTWRFSECLHDPFRRRGGRGQRGRSPVQRGRQEICRRVCPGPRLGPGGAYVGPAGTGRSNVLVGSYNTGLGQAIAQLSGLPYINIASVDLFSDLQDVVANPASYGLTDTTDMCIIPNVKGNAKCNNPNDYLFWDGIHPTSAGHAIIAEFIGPAL